jgi:ubiquinone/menaquinone biosynthesis C-methylase UbiE
MMQGNTHKANGDLPEKEHHHHKGKSSESLVDKKRVLNALNLRAGQTVLDAGCGNGYMSKVFSSELTTSGTVFALDPDDRQISVLRKETQGSIIQAIAGDITETTPLEPSSVDLIYLSTVFHGFLKQHVRGFLKEVERLLKPDALLAIVEFEKKPSPVGPPLEIRVSPEELKAVLPFAPVRTTDVGSYLYMQMFQNKDRLD